MDKIEMLMTITIGGFGLILSLMLIIWNHLNKRLEQLEYRIEKLEERITKIEHEMIEVKTILRFKECCMINDERKLNKAE